MKSRLDRRKGKLRKDEGGYALIWVLVVLIMAGIILVPLLLLMTAGLTSSHHHEERMVRFYSADAGIEDAAYKIQNDDGNLPQNAGDTYPYQILDVNGYQVDVTIENLWILTGLEDKAGGTMPHADLVVVGSITEEGTYHVEFSYDGKGELKINRMGAWLPAGYSYIDGSSSGVTTHPKIPDDPTTMPFRGGTALIWDFTAPQGIEFDALPPPGGGEPGSSEFPIRRVLSFQYTPSSEEPKGIFSWIRIKRMDIFLSWDVASGTYKITSTAGETTIEAYLSRAKTSDRISEIYGDYRAVGNSLMYDSDDDTYRDTLLDESSAIITKRSPQVEDLDIPEDAHVEAAYLYWAAWWQQEAADTEITLQVDSGPVMDIIASRWSIREHPFLPHDDVPEGEAWYAYACFADVTDQVSEISTDGDATYTITVGDVSGDVDAPYPDGVVRPVPWSYAGWSLIIIYSSAEEQAHQLYLYDEFGHAHDSTLHYVMEGFLAPADAEGYVSYFVGEGDEHLPNDYVQFKGESDTEWHYLYDEVNPQFNVMNSISSGLGGVFIDGVDIETFKVAGTGPGDPQYLSEGDTSAELKITTHSDGWDLVYVILSFRTVPGTETGLFPVSIMTYTYESY
ncbi:hypothetical protein ES703_06210 [subsurface metagenome]